MKRTLLFIAMTIITLGLASCKKDKDNTTTVENPLVGNWVIIGDEKNYDYTIRFDGVEEYFSFQDNGDLVEYLYGGKYIESVWNNGVLSGESWIPYKTYTWKMTNNMISFSPELWGTSEITYKKVNDNVMIIEGMAFGRVKQLVTTK